MLKVGVTGGIGSGKSLVCHLLEILGVPVYYADIRAKELMVEDEGLKSGIIQAFGAEAYQEDQVNRPFLADIVFKNPEKLAHLNGLVHPAIWKDIAAWFKNQAHHQYVVEESAILFETGLHKALDKSILVYAPEEIRVSRTMDRDQHGRESVLERMRNQINPEEAKLLADFVVTNDGESALIPQVLNIHEQLLNL